MDEHFERMRDGAILANAGGVDVEIDTAGLAESASEVREVRRNVEEFVLDDARRLYLVGRGMVVNLTAGDGHPVEIMTSPSPFKPSALTAWRTVTRV